MNRRQFIKLSLATGTALSSSFALASSLQQLTKYTTSQPNDYKALVCIFLYGGHDSFNLLVPTNIQDYSDYAKTRQSLAYSRESVINLQQDDVYPVGINNQSDALASLFNQQKLSIVSNVGPMVGPATKSELLANKRLLPPQLFSHNDQQALWQNSVLDTKVKTGWGGRIADVFTDPNIALPISFSLGGTNLFQSGTLAQHYALNTDGVDDFGALNPRYDWNNHRIEHYLRMMGDATNKFEKAYANKLLSVRENNLVLSQSLANVDDSNIDYGTDNSLADQLKMIAKLIQANQSLNQNRQIFFASLGGFDTHDNQAYMLPQLQRVLSQSLKGFDADLSQRGVNDNVVTFTQSEFGRTLTSNGDGTDHGWAGHQLVMGSPINGGRILGYLPQQTIATTDDLGDGRIIPTTSVEQFGAQLATWFGVSDTDLSDVFPNYYRFDKADFNLFS